MKFGDEIVPAVGIYWPEVCFFFPVQGGIPLLNFRATVWGPCRKRSNRELSLFHS